MKRALLLLAVSLGGCAHHPEPEIREVPVPTPVHCVTPEQIPAEPPRVAQRFNGNARHDLQILAPNALALRQWGEKLQTLLQRCAAPVPAASDAPPPTAKS